MSATPPTTKGPGYDDPRDLHERLHSATPTTFPGLDLDAAIASGRRTVRRRRIGTVVASVAAVAVVALGATALHGQLIASPTPAGQPTAPASTGPDATSALSGSTTLQVPMNLYATSPSGTAATSDESTPRAWLLQGTQTFVVSTTPDGQGQLVVTYAHRSSDGVVVVLSRNQIRLPMTTPDVVVLPGSRVMLGLLPSAQAQQRFLLTTSPDAGGFATSEDAVRTLQGTDFTAFALSTHTVFPEQTEVSRLVWFQADGRPVDLTGHTGWSATVDGVPTYLTADARSWGTDEASAELQSSDTLPVLAYGQAPSGPVMNGSATPSIVNLRVVGLAPAGATGGTLHLKGGRSLPFTATALGPDHSVYAVTVPDAPVSTSVDPASLTWVDAAGATHTISR